MSIYFVQEVGGERLVKIGFSDLPDRRVITVKSKHSQDVDVLAVIDGGRPVERMLHKQLEADRVRGEWFRPTDSVLQIVKSAQAVMLPKKRGSADVEYDETAEDMRIAFELIEDILHGFGKIGSKHAALEKIVFPQLHEINPMWTARRLRGLYGKENSSVPHWVVRNLEQLRDKAAGLAEFICPELKDEPPKDKD